MDQCVTRPRSVNTGTFRGVGSLPGMCPSVIAGDQATDGRTVAYFAAGVVTARVARPHAEQYGTYRAVGIPASGPNGGTDLRPHQQDDPPSSSRSVPSSFRTMMCFVIGCRRSGHTIRLTMLATARDLPVRDRRCGRSSWSWPRWLHGSVSRVHAPRADLRIPATRSLFRPSELQVSKLGSESIFNFLTSMDI
jgi:hypothetical protein